jgi:small subunit ribosomal protein S4
MARYRGPVEKLSRREGVQLYLKGERLAKGKGALERRPYPPGEHGRVRPRPSEYRAQLREKQKAKRYYGVLERQFRRYFDRALRLPGASGDTLLQLLELRLDNVVYRSGFASTRAQARQFVSHGHILVNGRKVDRPSYEVAPGDSIGLHPGSSVEPLARQAIELGGAVPRWLEADHEHLTGQVVRLPDPTDIDAPVERQLIVELYSR